MKSLTLTQIYKFYSKDLDEDSKYNIDYKTYREICEEFNKEVSRKILEEAWEFKMPYRLGSIRIKAIKMKYQHLKFNYELWAKQGIKSYHLNEHSAEHYGRWFWHKKNALIINKTFYSFKATRANSRALAKIMKQNGRKIKFFN